MKKNIVIIIIALVSLSACSKDNNDPIKEEQISTSEFQAKDFLCGPGYHLEFQVFDELRLFKKSGCNDGFGFCFGIRLNIVFDCVRNTVTSTANSENVFYDDETQYAKTLGIADPTTNEITFYFHRDITNSPYHNVSDFDYLDIENGVYLNDNVKLVGGSYPKIIDGVYYKYVVPYTDEK